MLSSGLMWYDPDSRKAPEVKIGEAARRYRERFGADPNVCHVGLEAVVGQAPVPIVANRWIRPGYFWLGIDEELVLARPPEDAPICRTVLVQRPAAAAPVPLAAGRRSGRPFQKSA